MGKFEKIEFNATSKRKNDDRFFELVNEHGIKFRTLQPIDGGKESIPWVDVIGPHAGRRYDLCESNTIEILVYGDNFSNVRIYSEKGLLFWQALIDAGIFEGGPYGKESSVSLDMVENGPQEKEIHVGSKHVKHPDFVHLIVNASRIAKKHGKSRRVFLFMSFSEILEKRYVDEDVEKAIDIFKLQIDSKLEKDVKKSKDNSKSSLDYTIGYVVPISTLGQWDRAQKNKNN